MASRTTIWRMVSEVPFRPIFFVGDFPWLLRSSHRRYVRGCTIDTNFSTSDPMPSPNSSSRCRSSSLRKTRLCGTRTRVISSSAFRNKNLSTQLVLARPCEQKEQRAEPVRHPENSPAFRREKRCDKLSEPLLLPRLSSLRGAAGKRQTDGMAHYPKNALHIVC